MLIEKRSDLSVLSGKLSDASAQADKERKASDGDKFRQEILNAAAEHCRGDDTVSSIPAACLNELTGQAFPQLPPPSYSWDTHPFAQFGENVFPGFPPSIVYYADVLDADDLAEDSDRMVQLVLAREQQANNALHARGCEVSPQRRV